MHTGAAEDLNDLHELDWDPAHNQSVFRPPSGAYAFD